MNYKLLSDTLWPHPFHICTSKFRSDTWIESRCKAAYIKIHGACRVCWLCTCAQNVTTIIHEERGWTRTIITWHVMYGLQFNSWCAHLPDQAHIHDASVWSADHDCSHDRDRDHDWILKRLWSKVLDCFTNPCQSRFSALPRALSCPFQQHAGRTISFASLCIDDTETLHTKACVSQCKTSLALSRTGRRHAGDPFGHTGVTIWLRRCAGWYR